MKEFVPPEESYYEKWYHEPTLNLDFQPSHVRPETIEALKIMNFTDDKGDAIQWTAGQMEIIDCILHRKALNGLKRIEIIALTQYGKSLAVAAGVSMRASTFPAKWAIVAGTTEKARIIMEYVIMLSLNNPILRAQLDPETPLDRLRMKKSADRLVYRLKGEVRVFSAEAKLQTETSKSLMGFGAENVIEDESALIGDILQATVMRMLGGYKDNFLVKIGNPFNRGHFLKTWLRGDYYRIFIDYHRAIDEGRIQQAFITEMMSEAMFDVLYQCTFPDNDSIDARGWLNLLTEVEVRRAFVKDEPVFGAKKLGVDVAGGGRNYSTMIERGSNVAKVIYKRHEPDTMIFAGTVLQTAKVSGIKQDAVFIDAVGIGRGAAERTKEQGYGVAVNAGEEPTDKMRFTNKRAEMYWRVRSWVLAGGKLEEHDDWLQLTKIKYKVADSSGKIKIMPKEEMLREGVDSPDIADGLSLTFYNTDIPFIQEQKPQIRTEQVSMIELDPYAGH
jgi:hypothetical protein